MNRLVLLFTVCVLVNFSSCAQDLIAKSDSLEDYYLKAMRDSDQNAINKFVECFPNSFEVFDAIYGYDDENDSLSILYDSAYEHIEFFFNSNCSRRLIYQKAVNIGIGGKWEADGVNYLQDHLISSVEAIDSDPFYLICDILSTHETSEIDSFWDFYFDRVIKMKTLSESYYRIEYKYDTVFKSMKAAYLRSQNQKPKF